MPVPPSIRKLSPSLIVLIVESSAPIPMLVNAAPPPAPPAPVPVIVMFPSESLDVVIPFAPINCIPSPLLIERDVESSAATVNNSPDINELLTLPDSASAFIVPVVESIRVSPF